jgi:hypothetical protein
MALLTSDPELHPTTRRWERRSDPSVPGHLGTVGVGNIGEFGDLNETWTESSIGFAPHTAPSMSGLRLLAILRHFYIRRDPLSIRGHRQCDH